MKTSRILPLFSALLLTAASLSAEPSHWDFAPKPPLGWNSWDIFGTTITEAQTREQADAMAELLLPSGYDILTVDIQWYEPNAKGHHYTPGAELSMDEYSRLTPAVNRFPSAAGGKGFKPLADYVHSKGLRFGIHIMRGIPRQAVQRNTPLLDTDATAADVGIVESICPWNPDMYGVDATTEAGQAYYDSLFQMYADWGVDYVKVDDISRPYDQVQKAEIEAIRNAIDKTGREMVLSLSPGATPIEVGEHVMQHANLWRITDDFWDRWGLLKAMFERCDAWTPFRRSGAWPDADMLPIGIIEFDRPTHFTKDEQYTLMTLWSIARSPLIFGGDMTRLDEFTLKMLTHPAMLEVNQNSVNNRQVYRKNNHIVWMADVPGSDDKYLALFNAQSEGESLDFASADYASPVIAGKGQSQEIELDITGASRLALFVTNGGDGFSWDHVVWVEPTLHGPKGTLKLTELEWVYADAGWGSPRINRTCEDKPLMVGGQLLEGIGTHSESKIIFDLPEGYERFTTKGVVTEDGSVMFAALAEETNGSTDVDTEVSVRFKDLGLSKKAKVRDLWSGEDLGTYQKVFSREIPQHGAGLYRVTPLR
ncbi:NPCBM/NEW2 domain-containing protein [Pelagicoccus sp. SDUM812003]|uniref:NPCBM/NEW2 domain-containing protein n=1 Tax=Pelagicoccus sp. SDUM812003 TaxID=3041267 RepID=UPI00280F6FE9|nr:NPCBM/NEW2 domain-containing protein [Pelagicoccus sp. SDUM812003]MDQ8205677.1 NPCBM/NEW2 domain-containing protein [Pelagicoccus sp. SDUM812003]